MSPPFVVAYAFAFAGDAVVLPAPVLALLSGCSQAGRAALCAIMSLPVVVAYAFAFAGDAVVLLFAMFALLFGFPLLFERVHDLLGRRFLLEGGGESAEFTNEKVERCT
jgi:uncharacterized membrane protein